MAKKKAIKKATKKATIKKATKKTAKKAIKKATTKTAPKAKKKAAPKATKKSASKVKNSSPKKSVKKSKMTAILPTLKEGAMIPQFALPSTGNKNIDLSEYKGRKVVLFFYPKDATPGCTIEGHEFTKLHQDFNNLKTEIFGISRDTVQSHEKFKAKEGYSIELLSDADEAFCKAFNVIKSKNMYGKQVMGVERSTFLIDEQGTVIKEWRGVKAEGHAQQVLDYIKSMNG